MLFRVVLAAIVLCLAVVALYLLTHSAKLIELLIWFFGAAIAVCGGIAKLPAVSKQRKSLLAALALTSILVASFTGAYRIFFIPAIHLHLSEKDIASLADALVERLSLTGQTTGPQPNPAEARSYISAAIKRILEEAPWGSAKSAIDALHTGDPDECLAILTTLAEHAEAKRAETQAAVIQRGHEIMALAFFTGRIRTAQDAVHRILAAARDDLAAVNYSGLIAHVQGDLPTAEVAFSRLTNLETETVFRAIGYGNLGLVYQEQGELDKALEMHERALAINEALGNKMGVANQYDNMGLIYRTRGQLDKALDLHEKASAINQTLGLPERAAGQYSNMGLVYEIRGDFDKALEMHEKALAIHKQFGMKLGIAGAYNNIGLVLAARGDWDKALDMFQKSLALHREMGSRPGIADQYNNIASFHFARGDLDKALEMYEKALEIDRQLHRKEPLANHYTDIGGVYLQRGELQQAIRMYTKAVALNEELGNREGLAMLFSNMGLIHQNLGNDEEALALYERALAIDREIGRKAGIAAVCANMASLYRRMGQLDTARNLWTQSEAFYRAVGNTELADQIHNVMSKLEAPTRAEAPSMEETARPMAQ